MIASLALLTLLGPQIVECPDPHASYITFQAIVATGPLGERDRTLAQIVKDTVLDATQDYNQFDLLRYSTLAGERMRCTLSEDHFRIQLEVPNGQMPLGAEILADILQHSRFDEDAVKAELDAVPFRKTSYWTEALQPWKLDFRRVKRDDLLAFYSKTFTPEATTISVGGAFVQGQARMALEGVLNTWEMPPKPRYQRKFSDPVALLERHAFPITTAELYGHEFTGSDASFPAQLLLASALGIGKGSALHQVLREKLGLSYLQQSAIVPTPGGFQLHLVLAAIPSDRDTALPDSMRKALKEDVARWSGETRQRALGIAKGFLQNQVPVTPLYLDGTSPLGFSLEDQTFLKGYWQEKTGQAWNGQHLLDLMAKISLDDLKNGAVDFLDEAQGAVVHG